MRIVIPVAVFSAMSLWAQQQQAPGPETVEKLKSAAQSAATPPAGAPAQTPGKTVEVKVPAEAIVPITALPPATVMATVDGEKVTAGDLQAVLKQLPQQVQQQAQSNRKQFVEQYGMLRKLSQDARKDKLDQQSPWKEAIEYGTMQVLYQAQINKKMAEMPVQPEEVKKRYEANKDAYLQAKVKAIYLPFSTAPVSQADSSGKKVLSETEAKEKAESLVKQLKGGGDFAALAKENSGDPKSAANGGDFGFIHKADPIPEDIKKVLFSSKPGEISEPVRQPNGFYVFRVDEVGPQPYEEVQGSITNEIKNSHFSEWLTALQKSLDVKMEHEVPGGLQLLPPQPSASPAPASK